ncbi:hypothetical protein MLD38_003272 [Melastoma candidum]|uniref:Uncharacterized protein n=1 Tax=Melastoma candidum TaxID=119954 RepID=A0ACB9S6K6_9MYRT|nr:hypothetical protein MLD38_003272 [Melastoma candidum]
MASIGYLEVFLGVVSFVLINRITNKGVLPKAWPIIGLVPQFLLHVNDFHEWVSEIMEGSGRNFLGRGVVYLHSDMLFTVDPANINFMLTVDFENFPKGPEYKRIFEVLGDGIFNSDFGSWKSQRRMAQSFLSHSKTVRFLGEVMREKIENVLAKMLDEFSKRRTIIDLQDLFDRLSLDLTCKLVTGFDQESLRIDLPGVKFSKALEEVEEAIFYRHVFPECTWKLQKRIGIGMESKLERAWQILDETAAEFIKLKRESLKNGVRQSETEQGMDMLKS